jgi:hypothetical protein
MIAQSEDEQRGIISKFHRDFLGVDQALSTNCNDEAQGEQGNDILNGSRSKDSMTSSNHHNKETS